MNSKILRTLGSVEGHAAKLKNKMSAIDDAAKRKLR